MDRPGEDATISSSSLLPDATKMPLETSTEVHHAANAEDAKAERRLKEAVRRYYALAELIDTERGYVDDLKILVEVYLASLGAVSAPPLGSRAESQPAPTPDIAESMDSTTMRSALLRSGSEASSSRLQTHSYQYPPSSFPTSAGLFKEHTEAKPKTRVRPASLQMLSVLQPQSIRSRKDSGVEPNSRRWARKSTEEQVRDNMLGMVGSVQGSGSTSSSEMGFGAHFHARNTVVGRGYFPNATRTGVRRASVDIVQTRAKPVLDHSFTSSPESSPHPSPLTSPLALPSTPSTPLSSQPASPLPTSSHMSQRHQRLYASISDAEKDTLSRDAQDLLALHERIVRRIEDTLSTVQREVQKKRRRLKGKEKAANVQSNVECEVEAAVRAVCSVFTSEAPNFAPYKVFCAGHTEAVDIARKIMRSNSSDWAEWEKHCAEIAVRQDTDGIIGAEVVLDSPLPSPLTVKPIEHSGSHNSLLSCALDVEDANSSTSTLRRRHSACASSGGLRASASATLKHTKSDPTPPAAHSHAQAYGFGNGYGSLSVKGLSRGQESANTALSPSGVQNEKEFQRERSRRTKLAFSDYLIKPVQRLCKYPLLFEQLRSSRKKETDVGPPPATTSSELDTGKFFAAAMPSGSSRSIADLDPDETPKGKKSQVAFRLGGDSDEEDDDSDNIDFVADENATDVAVERVLRKMRDVAHTVDDAQRRRDIEKKSALIVERLVAGAKSAGHGVPPALVAGVDLTDEENDKDEGGLESRSELGHGVGTISASASVAWSTKPPARSLSFSTFSRSRSRSTISRANSAFVQQQPQMSEFGEKRKRVQIPGPPTRPFLASLGACLLAGSLDVVVTNIDHCSSKSTLRSDGRRDSLLSLSGMSAMRSNNGLATATTYVSQSSREPVKVKYLAAFLYVGGYIVLAKTPKAGVYEPRHWFALTDESIEVVDVREEKALLPCSFHLIFHATGHRLELAAACQREKEIWLNAIHHARSLPPTWEYEPVPTLNVSANLVNAHSVRNSAEIPPVPSMPFLGDDVLAQDINPSRMSSYATLKSDGTVKPNRRQSVNGSSVRAFFMNNSDNGPPAPPTVLIRRVSATRRAQTDRHLADVLSQPLMSARFHAKAQDEVLFRDPDPPQQGTGIGVGAMAKNKLMGRESVLISKQCTPSICSSLASFVDQRSMISESASSITVQQHNQGSSRGKNTKKNQNRKSLSMLLTLPGAISEAEIRESQMSTPSSQSAFSPSSPLPSTSTTNSLDPFSQSQCSSASTSAPTSSPINELFPPEVRVVGVDTLTRADGEELPEVVEHMDRPKRSRSLVSNLRGFFGTPRSLSSSPAPSLSSSRQTSVGDPLEVPDAESTPQKGMLSRILRSTSLRPRARSASNMGDSTSTQLLSSSTQDSGAQSTPARPSFFIRSSSMLVVPRRKPDASATAKLISPVQAPTPFARLDSRSSQSSLTPEARSQMSLGRSIKYRLFPGNLVPLTPIDRRRDRRS
ncbi:hypothetical protein ACEPAF_6237 [Sanghuangporus sanghuang]